MRIWRRSARGVPSRPRYPRPCDAWRNWAGDQACSPAVFERPVGGGGGGALGRAADAKHTVRVAGSGHSFSEAVLTNDTLMSLDAMDRVLDVDRESGLVRVQAGIGLRR